MGKSKSLLQTFCSFVKGKHYSSFEISRRNSQFPSRIQFRTFFFRGFPFIFPPFFVGYSEAPRGETALARHFVGGRDGWVGRRGRRKRRRRNGYVGEEGECGYVLFMRTYYHIRIELDGRQLSHTQNRYQHIRYFPGQTVFKFESFFAPSLMAKERKNAGSESWNCLCQTPNNNNSPLSPCQNGERKGWSRRKSQERTEKGERHDTFVCIPRMYGTRCVGCTTKKGGRKGVCFH